jgi:hypothetical protein
MSARTFLGASATASNASRRRQRHQQQLAAPLRARVRRVVASASSAGDAGDAGDRAPEPTRRRVRRVGSRGLPGPGADAPRPAVAAEGDDAPSPSPSRSTPDETTPRRREPSSRGGRGGGGRGGGRGRGRGDAAADQRQRVPPRNRRRDNGKSGRRRASDAARAVNDALSRARTIDDLRVVVEANDLAASFNVVNVATAYSRLGRHVEGAERGTLDDARWYLALETRAFALLPELGGWAASSLTWALGRTGRDPGAKFWEALERVLLRKASELEPQGVANILWAFAVLERKHPVALSSALETAATKFCKFAGSGAAANANATAARLGGGRGGRGRERETVPTGFKPYELTMMFWALTRFGEEPSVELRGLFEAQCGRVLNELKPRELANVASAYGRIGRAAPLLAAVADEACAGVGLDRFKPQEFSMLLWGLAKAASASRDAAAPSSTTRARFDVSDSFDGGFGGLVAGLASTSRDEHGGGLISSQALEMIADELQARASADGGGGGGGGGGGADGGGLEPKELCLAAWAVATLQPRAERKEMSFDAREANAATKARKKSASSTTTMPAMVAVEAAAARAMRDFNPQDFANLIWAFAKLDHTPGATFQEAFEDALIRKISKFSPQALANVAYGYASLGLPGSRNVLPFVALHLTKDVLTDVETRELVMVMWSFAQSGYDPGAEFIARAEDAALRVVDAMEPDEVTQYLWSLASLRYRPRAAFLRAVESRIDACPAKFDAQAVTLTLWVYATLGIVPSARVTERFADEIDAMTFEDFNPQDLSLGFWAAAVLRAQPRGDRGDDAWVETALRGLASKLPALEASAVSPGGLSAMFQGILTLRMVDAETGGTLSDELGARWAHLEDDAEAAYRGYKTDDPTVSLLQQDVAMALTEMGLTFEIEAFIDGGLIRPDITLTGGGDATDRYPGLDRVVIEVDGPCHYSVEPSDATDDTLDDWFSGGGGGGDDDDDDDSEKDPIDADGKEGAAGRWPLGSTVLRNQLLRSSGLEVVTVTYHEWDRMTTPEDQRAYLRGLLERATEQPR